MEVLMAVLAASIGGFLGLGFGVAGIAAYYRQSKDVLALSLMGSFFGAAFFLSLILIAIS